MNVAIAVYDFIKDSDLFGRTIHFTYDKKSKFKTMFGGIVSTFIYAFTSYMMIVMLTRVYNRSDIKTSKNTKYKNFISQNEDYVLNSNDIRIALRWNDINGDVVPPEIGSLHVYNIKYGNNSRDGTQIPEEQILLELEECNEYNFSPDSRILARLEGHY